MNYVEVILNVGIFMFIKLMWKMENDIPKTVFPKPRHNGDPKNRYF